MDNNPITNYHDLRINDCNPAIMTCTGPYFLFFCRGFKLVGPMVIMVYRMLAQVLGGNAGKGSLCYPLKVMSSEN
jgi:hypothetical protein